jgi:carboxyl-terminal processing protease
MDRPYRSWDDETSATVGMFQSFGMLGRHAAMSWSGDSIRPQNGAYSGSLFLLVDDGCYSACEEFVMPFRDSHRGVLIGERTAGSSGQTHIVDFGNEMALGLGARRHSFPGGAPFEGVGIAPDVEVHTTAADLLAGRDPVLERALTLAEGRNNP